MMNYFTKSRGKQKKMREIGDQGPYLFGREAGGY